MIPIKLGRTFQTFFTTLWLHCDIQLVVVGSFSVRQHCLGRPTYMPEVGRVNLFVAADPIIVSHCGMMMRICFVLPALAISCLFAVFRRCDSS